VVIGLDRFREHFAAFTDQYILIGGAACTVVMEEVGQDFRATKDLDIVLCVEALNAEFGTAFWQFIGDGQYEHQQKSTGQKQFYRFHTPAVAEYPFMLELFSRAPEVLTPAEGSHLTPIPLDEEISSLSAILMDKGYYDFLQSGKRVIDGLQVAGPEHLIPLKARAWLDMAGRIAAGSPVDSRNHKKHQRDVFRLFAIIDPDFGGDVPLQVKEDLRDFLAQMKNESIDLRVLGLANTTFAEVDAELQRIYRLD
jgi:hypothetical protein